MKATVARHRSYRSTVRKCRFSCLTDSHRRVSSSLLTDLQRCIRGGHSANSPGCMRTSPCDPTLAHADVSVYAAQLRLFEQWRVILSQFDRVSTQSYAMVRYTAKNYILTRTSLYGLHTFYVCFELVQLKRQVRLGIPDALRGAVWQRLAWMSQHRNAEDPHRTFTEQVSDSLERCDIYKVGSLVTPALSAFGSTNCLLVVL